MSLAADYAPTCFWNDDAKFPPGSSAPLPGRTDVLVVGAGYTGLAAARETARAGRSTVVVDAGPIGGGCSSRNGGQVGFSIKPELSALSARHGPYRAERIYREAFDAIAELRAFAATPGVDIDWRQVGCFCGAHTRRHFAQLCREAENQPQGLELKMRIVPPSLLSGEIESDFYHGGVVYEDDASVHPLKLLDAVHRRAVDAGALAYDACAVHHIARDGTEFLVATERGTVRARQVLLATNGYTGALSPWHRRRLIPIGSYVIATETLEGARVRRLIPHGRNVVDTRHLVIYVRPSPDGRRILFGGRAAAAERDVTRCVPRLRRMMADVFPDLADVAVSRAWMGFVAFTFDTLPHLGEQDGLFHCMGYCGQGVPLALYYGRRVGLQMVGDPAGETALNGVAFPTRPLYDGRPWFLPAAILSYRVRDALGL